MVRFVLKNYQTLRNTNVLYRLILQFCSKNNSIVYRSFNKQYSTRVKENFKYWSPVPVQMFETILNSLTKMHMITILHHGKNLTKPSKLENASPPQTKHSKTDAFFQTTSQVEYVECVLPGFTYICNGLSSSHAYNHHYNHRVLTSHPFTCSVIIPSEVCGRAKAYIRVRNLLISSSSVRSSL